MADREQTKTMAKTPARAPVKPLAKAAVKPAIKTPAKITSKPKTPLVELPAVAIKRLEAENAQLSHDLAAATARVAELEQQRDGALDRIGWVIDSLHSLREEQG